MDLWFLLALCLRIIHANTSGADVVHLSVTEGDSVFLPSVKTMDRNVHISWMFERELIAEISSMYEVTNVNCESFKDRHVNFRSGSLAIGSIGYSGTYNRAISYPNQPHVTTNYVNCKIFRNRLHVNFKTGSLTIRNTRTTDSGIYERNIYGSNPTFDFVMTTTTFAVTVYARLPSPVIKDGPLNCSSSSSSSSSVCRCFMLCSAVNVSSVSLSWFKGERLLSSISAPDHSSGLSLALEVEYQERNTYSCVLNNTIRNQTTHLNISSGQQCPGRSTPPFYLLALIPVFLVAAIISYWIYRKLKQSGG